jgi:hypothetical protein
MTHTKLLDIEIDEDDDIDLENFEEVRHFVYHYLFNHEVSKAVVEFTGGNDEGSVDTVTITFRSGKVIEIDSADYKNLYTALCSPVYYEYDSFAMEGHVDGKIDWIIDKEDKNKSVVVLEGSQSYEHWDDISKEL